MNPWFPKHGGAFTVATLLPAAVPLVARMTVLPGACAVTRPVLLTVAIVGLSVVNATVPTVTGLSNASAPVALARAVSPAPANLRVSGDILIFESAAAVTVAVKLALPATPDTVAAAAWVPAVVPTVHCVLACPLPSVVELAGLTVPDEVLHDTATPDTALPDTLVTFATSVAEVALPAVMLAGALLLTT
jgi:hypothetical protein